MRGNGRLLLDWRWFCEGIYLLPNTPMETFVTLFSVVFLLWVCCLDTKPKKKPWDKNK